MLQGMVVRGLKDPIAFTESMKRHGFTVAESPQRVVVSWEHGQPVCLQETPERFIENNAAKHGGQVTDYKPI